MSAASSARSQVHDAAPPVSVPSRAAQSPAVATAAAKRSSAFSFAAAETEDQFKLNLSDIPHIPYTMEVEGLKPSLLSRLVGLIVK